MDNTTIIEGEVMSVTDISLGTFFKIPAVRQVVLLIGVAVSVAAGVAIVLWSQTPTYSRIYADLDGADAAEVATALRAADIDFELDPGTGSVMVPESRLHAARLELASQGLPQRAAVGMESLQEQSVFGQSQFRENALYQHALEAELARTITYLGTVRDARVHLALPRQSAFIRNRNPASASVMLNLYRELESDQAASIVHLVASSVPNLLAGNITVIDQQGRLLSSGERAGNDALTTSQFKLAERLERTYKRRIEALLTPLLGAGRVRAEVVVDMDFTEIEETRESFDPDRSALISESVSHNQRSGGDSAAQGVPGALSNQPPEAAGSGAGNAAQAGAAAVAVNEASSSTRNFEVERTISHTRPQTGTIRRLSIAVLVDDTPVVTVANAADDTADGTADGAADGTADGAADETAAATTEQRLTDADIAQFTALVKEAVGFDVARGDTVVVVPAAFRPVPEAIPAEETKIWQEPVVVDSVKLILGAVLVLALAFGLVRPMLKSLLAANVASMARIPGSGVGGELMLANAAALPTGQAALPPPSFDEKMAAAKNMSGHDPAKVAQVVRKWVGEA